MAADGLPVINGPGGRCSSYNNHAKVLRFAVDGLKARRRANPNANKNLTSAPSHAIFQYSPSANSQLTPLC